MEENHLHFTSLPSSFLLPVLEMQDRPSCVACPAWEPQLQRSLSSPFPLGAAAMGWGHRCPQLLLPRMGCKRCLSCLEQGVAGVSSCICNCWWSRGMWTSPVPPAGYSCARWLLSKEDVSERWRVPRPPGLAPGAQSSPMEQRRCSLHSGSSPALPQGWVDILGWQEGCASASSPSRGTWSDLQPRALKAKSY